jgi:hypothetical protein
MAGRERALTRNGVLAATESDLYRVEAGTRLYLHSLTAQNPSGAGENIVSIYLLPNGGTSRLWAQAILKPAERMEISDWLLAELDTLRGCATSGEQVTWTMSGSLESVDV